MDDEEPCAKQRGEQGVDAHGARVDTAKQSDEKTRRDCDEDEEGAAMAMMKTVAHFKLGWCLATGERACVEETIGGVEHPDCDKHRGR
jgi:hypothetical protein